MSSIALHQQAELPHMLTVGSQWPGCRRSSAPTSGRSVGIWYIACGMPQQHMGVVGWYACHPSEDVFPRLY